MRYQVFEDGHYYICHDGRELQHIRTESRTVIPRLLRYMDARTAAVVGIGPNENFRRFHYRSSEKVYKDFRLYAMGPNMNKYHCFLHQEIEKYEGKRSREQLREGSAGKKRTRGFAP